jgi:hypothetical protein
MLKQISPIVLALGLAAATTVQADHNSLWGEGWANMPNDVHNTRIDTMDEDTDSFIDFVRMGSGAASDNRFLVDSTDTAGGGSSSRGGSAGGRR